MLKGFDMFKDNREFSQIEPVNPDLARMGYNILRSAYCAEAINQVPVEAGMALRHQNWTETNQSTRTDPGTTTVRL